MEIVRNKNVVSCVSRLTIKREQNLLCSYFQNFLLNFCYDKFAKEVVLLLPLLLFIGEVLRSVLVRGRSRSSSDVLGRATPSTRSVSAGVVLICDIGGTDPPG